MTAGRRPVEASAQFTREACFYEHAAHHFANARRALMLPRASDHVMAFVQAFAACTHALTDQDLIALPLAIRRELADLQKFMHTEAEEQRNHSQWGAKTSSFTIDEKIRIADLIDSLADWFLFQYCLRIRDAVQNQAYGETASLHQQTPSP